MVQQDPGLLDQVMRTVASYDNAAGKLRGFRAYPGRNRAIFNKLGLKPGDLVTAINGQTLDDPQHSQEVFNTIQSSPTVTVTIERGGQKQDISLNIAQIAGEATKDLESEPGAGGTPNGAPLPERSAGSCPRVQTNDDRDGRTTLKARQRRIRGSLMLIPAGISRSALVCALSILLASLAPAAPPGRAHLRRRRARPSRPTTRTPI